MTDSNVIQFVPGLKKPSVEQRRLYAEYRDQLAAYERLAHADTAPSEYTAPDGGDCA